MIAIRLICAWEAFEQTRAVARLLEAETFDVRVAAGRAALEDLSNPDRGDEIFVFVWSQNAGSSPYVEPWLKAAEPDSFVELRLPEGEPPDFDKRHDAPIDFTHWRGDRGGEPWKELERRLRRAATRNAHPAPVVEPVRAAMAFGAIAVVALSAAVATRLLDNGHTARVDAAEGSAAQPITLPVAAPQHVVEMGGPEPAARLEEPATAFDPDAFTPLHPHRFSARVLPVVPAPSAALSRASLAAPMDFRERTLLNALAQRLRTP